MGLEIGARTGDDATARRALGAWVDRGRPGPLGRWLDGVLDREGVPRRLPVGDWAGLLARLDEARRRRPEGWPDAIDAGVEGMLRATLRFARPSGSSVFGPPGVPPDPAAPEVFRGWADRLSDPGLGTVLDWWFPRRRRAGPAAVAAPPLPAWSSPDRPLAMLRAGWSIGGDYLAIDHRARGVETLVELGGAGRVWLGPRWAVDDDDGAGGDGASTATIPRPTTWSSTSTADLAEWTFRLGALRVTRTALLLRGRRIALIADQVEGRAGAGGGERVGWRVALPEGVEASPSAEGRGWTLANRRGRASARLVPLGLPRSATGGTLEAIGGTLRLRRPFDARRCWLPLLVSWDPVRDRKPIDWRPLTVAERSRACPADAAFAARVTWGRGESLLIYRSLARPALRSVLGHQTRARFLVALFGADGKVTPLVRVD